MIDRPDDVVGLVSLARSLPALLPCDALASKCANALHVHALLLLLPYPGLGSRTKN